MADIIDYTLTIEIAFRCIQNEALFLLSIVINNIY